MESKLPQHLIHTNELHTNDHDDRPRQPLHEKFSETIRHQFYLDKTNSLFTIRIYVASAGRAEEWCSYYVCARKERWRSGDISMFCRRFCCDILIQIFWDKAHNVVVANMY